MKKTEKLLAIEKKRQEKKVKRMREKVKTELYPFLVKTGGSVQDVQMLVKTLSVGLHQAFQNQMLKQKVKQMELDKMVDKKNKNNTAILELIKMFEEETLADAFNMIDNFCPTVDTFVREEMSKKPFSELKATFL